MDNNREISINIILPTIGRPSLDRAIQSVIDQEYKDWHLWIICDGPCGVPNIAFSDQKIEVYEIDGPHNDSGASARNNGIYRTPENSWILYLDCDDIFLNHHLSTITKIIDENPEINMGRTCGQEFRMKHLHPRTSCRKMKLGAVNSTDIMTPGLFHTKELFLRTKGWTNDLNRHDSILWQDMINAGGTYVESKEVTFLYEK